MDKILKVYYQRQDYDNQVIHVVTRLDRDTSGVMLFAKHAFAHGLIDQQMQQKGIEKTYLVVSDKKVPDLDHALIYAPMARSPRPSCERRVADPREQPLTKRSATQ